ncbi:MULTISPECIES: hypothetical protein [Noviherbaspirillum]|uniref:hypothetical protein n=1 Tax=Noviherbaspirillum TaxID=1344552 RepID=UPI00124E2D44|nr:MULTISPECIES: hypothetical protein [Noviherbaspirillum]
MPYVLIVMTFLGGSGAWDPTVSIQEFSTQPRCEQAKEAILATFEEMNKINTLGRPTYRQILSAECKPK